MGSGTNILRGRAAAACALAAAVLCGCAAIDPQAVLAERESAMQRWSSCVDRHAGLGTTSVEAIEVTRDGCDGYRRDVALTFAPHMARRVQARLDASERRRVVDERVDRAAASGEPLSTRDRMRERIDHLLLRTAAGREDG